MERFQYLLYRVRDTLQSMRKVLLLVLIGAFLLLIAFLIFSRYYIFLIVNGNSMQTSVRPQDILFCERNIDIIKYGDIVCIDTENEAIAQSVGASKEICKRVVAVGGDTVEIIDGYVYRNGTKIREPYVCSRTDVFNGMTYTIPDGYVFVMGDNRVVSLDSRSYGAIKVTSLNGRLLKNLTTEYGVSKHSIIVTVISVITLFVVIKIGNLLKHGSTRVGKYLLSRSNNDKEDKDE